LTAIERTGETWCESDIHRTAGEIALRPIEPDVGKARMHLDRALAVAREQQAKSWELRAANSLAPLWLDQGERDAVRELLATVDDWFTEGFDTRDLQESLARQATLGVVLPAPVALGRKIQEGGIRRRQAVDHEPVLQSFLVVDCVPESMVRRHRLRPQQRPNPLRSPPSAATQRRASGGTILDATST
jgi:hypothetical protein